MSVASHRDLSAAPPSAARTADTGRRRFLMLGAGAASAAAAAPVLAAPAAIVESVEPKPVSQGYRETEHVRNYYASTRL